VHTTFEQEVGWCTRLLTSRWSTVLCARRRFRTIPVQSTSENDACDVACRVPVPNPERSTSSTTPKILQVPGVTRVGGARKLDSFGGEK